MKFNKKNLFILNLFAITLLILITLNIAQTGTLTNLDQTISQNIENIWNKYIIYIFVALTQFASVYFVILVTAITLAYLIIKKLKHRLYFFLTNAIIGETILFSLKEYLNRARPENQLTTPLSASYPSGHTTTATFLSLTFFFIFKERIQNLKQTSKLKYYSILTFLISYPLIIGFSRIYLNVHWFTDVIAGFLLGYIQIITIYLIFNKLEIKFEKITKEKLNETKQK